MITRLLEGGEKRSSAARRDASVTFGAYFNVLRVLGLQEDVLKLVADDEFGRKLQDLKLLKSRK